MIQQKSFYLVFSFSKMSFPFEFLEAVFPVRWFAKGRLMEWPVSSADLNPLHYFLWGSLDSKVFTWTHRIFEDEFASKFSICYITQSIEKLRGFTLLSNLCISVKLGLENWKEYAPYNINKKLSSRITTSRVLQGSNLGPLLSVLYINNFCNNLICWRFNYFHLYLEMIRYSFICS